MLDEIKSKLEELQTNEKDLNPQIEEIKSERDEKIEEIKQKYEKKISTLTSDLEQFRTEISNDLINSFVDAVMKEFDAKRSTSEYTVTEDIKEYRASIANIDMFPSELIDKLDKIISKEVSIENIAYDLESIKEKHLKAV
jgi:DNA repair exonuclease SbcCD ATPase subunit